jgi:hypothetical protein
VHTPAPSPFLTPEFSAVENSVSSFPNKFKPRDPVMKSNVNIHDVQHRVKKSRLHSISIELHEKIIRWISILYGINLLILFLVFVVVYWLK